MKPAQIERAELIEAARTAGPDAPTLCGDWTVRDLLAHLVLREGRPDAMPGIMVGALSGYTERVQAKIAARSFDDLLATVASGPPRLSPYRLFDDVANLGEFFVHTEDIRRADTGWRPRRLDRTVEKGLAAMVSRLGRLILRSAPLKISLTTETGTIVTVGKGPSVSVIGAIGEVTLWTFGRDEALVTFEGNDQDISELETVQRSL